MQIDVSKSYTATLHTVRGDIVIALLPQAAPLTVNSFVFLARQGFYDGVTFHRVIPGFMIQGGCPNSKPGAKGVPGTGGPGYNINAEFNDTKHKRGILSMARSSSPNSAGCQFFIMVADYPSLDGQYSAFGRVVTGMEVADKIVSESKDERDMPRQRVEMTVEVVE